MPRPSASLHNLCLLVGLSLGILACEQPAPSEPPGPSGVARVNGENISEATFIEALNELKEAGKGFFSSAETANRVKRDLLERLIEGELLLQEARRKGIHIDPKLVEAKIRLLDSQYQQGGLKTKLAKQDRKLEDYRRETTEGLLIEKLIKQEVIDRIAISRQEIEAFYERHGDLFLRPDEVRVRQIVTRTEEEAEKLRRQIHRGEDFTKLAAAHSLGPEGKQGGDLGYFPRGRMPPVIDEVCFKLYLSQKVSKVVASPYGYHLFKLVDKRPARQLSLDDARKEIEHKLVDERAKEAESYFIRSLRERARIDRDFALLDRIH